MRAGGGLNWSQDASIARKIVGNEAIDRDSALRILLRPKNDKGHVTPLGRVTWPVVFLKK